MPTHDLEAVVAMFEALARGHLASVGPMLTPQEIEHMPFSGPLITVEIGMRFLTDYLSGDTYFEVSREGQNLDRGRTQFKLVESIEAQQEDMNRVMESLRKHSHQVGPA